LRFDAFGTVLPAGKTVTNPALVGFTAVTLTTTDVAFVGIPARPVICTSVRAFETNELSEG